MRLFCVLVGVCLLVVSQHGGVDGALIVLPQSTAVIESHTFQLNCAADNNTEDGAGFNWNYNGLSATPVRIVYSCQVNPDYASMYQVEQNDAGECNLIVLNGPMSAAGTYSCQNGFDQASATIVMLGSNSNCNAIPATDLVTGDFIRISCVVNYNGSMTPRMAWSDNSTGYPINNGTTNTYPTQVNSYIDVPVFPPTTRPYMSTTYFDYPIAYRFTWTLPPLNVQYFVTNLVATARIRYFTDTSIVCTANGYPLPTFRINNLDTNEWFDAASIPVSANGVGRYRCTASNTIRGETVTLDDTISTDIIEAVPAYCPTTTTEATTTTTEATTTTSPPTTTPEPIGECGRLMSSVPPDQATPPSGWTPLCYISRSDTALLSTQCRNLISDLPAGYANYTDLMASGGNFGCTLATRADYVQAPQACYDDFQQTSMLAACPTCPRLFVCIRLP